MQVAAAIASDGVWGVLGRVMHSTSLLDCIQGPMR